MTAQTMMTVVTVYLHVLIVEAAKGTIQALQAQIQVGIPDMSAHHGPPTRGKGAQPTGVMLGVVGVQRCAMQFWLQIVGDPGHRQITEQPHGDSRHFLQMVQISLYDDSASRRQAGSEGLGQRMGFG